MPSLDIQPRETGRPMYPSPIPKDIIMLRQRRRTRRFGSNCAQTQLFRLQALDPYVLIGLFNLAGKRKGYPDLDRKRERVHQPPA